MKKIILLLMVAAIAFAGCKNQSKKATKENTTAEKVEKSAPAPLNTLTDQEKKDGWVLLFDGKTSDGWRGYKKDHFPAGWEVADGTLHCIGSGRGEAGSVDGGDIIYDKKFGNFDLKLDWKISEGGNSGIMYLGQETKDHIWETAPEMQILDNERHP